MLVDNKPVTALLDTGASTYLMLRKDIHAQLSRTTTTTRALRRPMPLIDWERKRTSKPITHEAIADMHVDGWHFPRERFLISETMGNEAIIGRPWFDKHNADISVRRRCIIWPEQRLRSQEPSSQVRSTSRPRTTTPAIKAVQTYPTDTPARTIPIPVDEDQKTRDAIAAKLPSRLQRWAGFFSKRASLTLPRSRGPGKDVILKLRKPLPDRSPPLYRTPPALYKELDGKIDSLLAHQMITRANLGYASPALFAPKHDDHEGKKAWRFCIDYRTSNDCIEPMFCPMPQLAETVERVSKARLFTKIDIRQAFHRMLIDPASRPLTAFKCRRGTFVWNVLPFGLQVGPAWFQQYINKHLGDALDRFTSAYADDVLLYTNPETLEEEPAVTMERHLAQVATVIERLHIGGL
jgi:hypothetical protein